MTPTDQLFADRYQLDRSLGAGGMSTVRLAFDTRLERYVAVKVLAEHLAHDSGFVARFRREALAAARLVHPNIVQVFDFGLDQSSGRQFIVMEHVDGRSGAELLREYGALPPEEAVEMAAQACRGLDYAHRNGVIHRDVKPGNLLRNREGQVKLADFGIAKAAEQSDITKVGSVLGTAAYLSPEQTRGEPAGPASDLYALGVVGYQLLTGRLPYEGKSLPELARQQEAGLPPRPDRINPSVPPALGSAVIRALAPAPQERYASAAEMEQALRGALQGIPPTGADATVALAGNDATRILDSTAATSALAAPRRRGPLQPLPEEPRRAPQPDLRPPRREPVEPRGRGRRREPVAPPSDSPPGKWRGFKLFLWLILVLALIAGGAMAYQEFSESARRAVDAGQEIRGDVQQAVDQLREVIENNIR
jgi:serine/threonine protein kinase